MACKDVRHDLAAVDQDPLHYDMAEAIAVSTTLRQAIGAIGSAIALWSFSDYGPESTAINATAALCSQDGVKGVSG